MKPVDTKAAPRLVQEQRLILTQELQLFLKLIQMTTLELKEYLEQELAENPVLEEEIEEKITENPDSKEDFNFKSFEDSFLGGNQGSLTFKEPFEEGEEEIPWESRVSKAQSLLDHLNWQLSLSDFSPEEKQIASVIIGNTNEDGYLEMDIEEIALLLMKQNHEPNSISETEDTLEETALYENPVVPDESYVRRVEEVLKKIQFSFDPPGVCARSLKECLKIQAEELGYDGVVKKIIEDYLEDIGKRDYEKTANTLGISTEEVERAASFISSLEPKPGRPFYMKDIEKYIVPDFYIYKVGNDLQIQLNRDFPKVRVSQYYKTLFKQGANLSTDVKKYIKEKLEAAQRIVKCLEERDAAVKKIMAKIVEYQKDFFEYGTNYIRPLRLKDIAQAVGVHESTVSRITSRRYVYTPQGTVGLKSLFCRRIETSHGEEVSFERVKTVIKEIIASEPPENPYSDDDISKMLERRNIKVARRTVAKYRKILKIPSSSERMLKKRGKSNADYSNHKAHRPKQG
ncbi:MAG: RNA polymerase sigma-54 factor [Candidatus Dadabacteria bacterium]